MTGLPDPVAQAAIAGYAVVPADMDKRPKVKWRQWTEAHQTLDEQAALGHGSLWAVITGELYGCVVLDFDGPEGLETMEWLDLEPHVRTAAGAHVYVRHPGHPVKSSAKRFDAFPGLDIKGERSLAFFYGRSKKGTYEPVNWPPGPVELPAVLAEVLFPHPQETRQAERAAAGTWDGPGSGSVEALRYLRRACEDITRALPGSSNAALNKAGFAVGGLIGAGQLEEEYAYRALLEAAIERDAGDPEIVLESALLTGRERPWKFDPPVDDEFIPLATARKFRQSAVPEPTPFPVSALPSPLDELVRQGSRSLSCPPDYLGAGVLTVLGTAVGGYADIEITEAWKEPALLYTALVGPPSVRKTPAIKLLLDPVWDAQKALFAEAKERQEDPDQEWTQVDPPRIVVDDSTIEALFGVMERNPRGVILAPDELDGWVGGMGQYKAGLGRDRQHWLSIWSRRPIAVDRKKSTSHMVENPFVAVLGGIQPDPLEALMQGKNDGLLPRILMARGEFITPVLGRNLLDRTILDRYSALWNDLRDDGMLPRTTVFTDPGYRAYETWVNNDHYKTLGKVPDELAGAWGKMDAQAARIALILARILGTEVTPDIVDRAVTLVRYFQGQAAGLLQGSTSASPYEKQNAARQKHVVRFLQDNPGARRADVMTSGPDWCMDSRTLDRLIESLEAIGIEVPR